MNDTMRPVPFEELINRMFSEYRQNRTIFSIHEDQFYRNTAGSGIDVFGQHAETPLGPAAGPHTQLAQNIIASYLVGGRFLELKTVQVLDTLEVEKPCIDARDEGYNVEWSTEFTLEKAHDEYVKAYIILHLLDALFHNGDVSTPSFIFNMSIGYDLKGIKTPKMQQYIDSMIDAGKSAVFASYIESLKVIIEENSFLEGTPWSSFSGKLKTLPKMISKNISPSITISTMHGCPPAEIEAICSYILKEKNLHTFVKLNPTLLGYEAVREILDTLGYDYLHLSRESFEHDLQYSDAIAMLKRLRALAAEKNLGFGVKLTNTLGSINDQGVLPGQEMYMSGRALLPISTRVASLLSKEFEGQLPISYSGGANAFTVLDLFESGIRPITLATDLLKPGGYTRLKQMAEILEKDALSWERKDIDVEKIGQLAEKAISLVESQKDFRGEDTASVPTDLPLTDCYIAPCVVACPIHQMIPDYIQLVGEGRYADALEVIYDSNALPNLTGYICDHQCQYHCTRMDYEGAVKIREMKKIAAENGFEEYLERWEKPESTDIRAAVIGAGPAGLSAAYFLSRAGFSVTVYEREENAGGVTRYVIPSYRFPESALQADIDFIKAHGVEFVFGASQDELKVDALKLAGYEYLFYAIGAEVDNAIGLKGDTSKVSASLEFLGKYNRKEKLALGEHVVVVGGGNTAMDSARSAMRVEGVTDVTVVYRRTKKQMPADLEEYENALEDGVKFIFLANPESLTEDGVLSCTVMTLGEPDASGRARPVATDESFDLPCDTLITAIGEKVDGEKLSWFGLPLNERGWAKSDRETLESEIEHVYVIGDAMSGPSTIVQCIASGRKAVESAIDSVLTSYDEVEEHSCECGNDGGCEGDCGCDHDHHHHHDHDEEDEEELSDEELAELVEAENDFFSTIRSKKSMLAHSLSPSLSPEAFATREAVRCLECSYICNKCVDVCPNRANVAIDVRERNDLFDHPFQIVHLDAFCNECGNCATFCPHQGSPYRDKLTLFSLEQDFLSSTNSGFFVNGDQVQVRENGEIFTLSVTSDGLSGEGVSEEVEEIISQIVHHHSYLLGSVDL